MSANPLSNYMYAYFFLKIKHPIIMEKMGIIDMIKHVNISVPYIDFHGTYLNNKSCAIIHSYL